MKIRLLSLLPFIFLLAFCSVADPPSLPSGSQLMLNPNLSLYPDSVIPWESYDFRNHFDIGISREVFFTGNRSLFVENKDSTEFATGGWSQTYSGPMPAQGSTVELVAFIKGENIKSLRSGNDVSMSFTANVNDGERVRATAFNQLEGDFDWYLLRATMDSFPSGVNSISVGFGLNSRVLGKAYFDEINLFVR